MRRNLVELALLGLAFQGLGWLVWGPLVGAGFALLISRSGSSVVGNQELAGFFSSPTGVALALGLLLVRATRDLLMMAGFVALLQAERAGGSATALQALKVVLRRLGGALSIGGRQAVRVGLGLAPFVAAAAGLAWLVVGDLDLQYLFAVKPPRFWVGVVGVGALVVGALVTLVALVARWTLAVPMWLRGAVTSRAALAESSRRVGTRWKHVALRLGEWWLAVAVAGALLSSLCGWLGIQAVELAARSFPGATPVALALLLLGGVVLSALIDLLAWSGQAAYVVQLDEELAGGPAGASQPAARPHSPVRVWIGALLLALAGVGTVAAAAELLEPPRPVFVTAHRGSSAVAPENSRAALLQAIADRADYAEIDVQELADGAIVVFHDSDLMRIAGSAEQVWQLDLERMRAIDVGAWFDPRFAGEVVMTLEEAIAVAGDVLRLNIELKPHGRERALVPSLVDTLRRTGFVERCVVTSLDAPVLRQVRALAPEVRLGFIVSASIGDRLAADVDLLAVSTRLATRAEVRRARAAGLELHVWTVNERTEMERFLARGVDGILTDHPARLRALLDERAELGEQELLLDAVRRWWTDD